MIRAYVGLMGQGKTLAMTRDLVNLMKQGIPVISNYKISFPHPDRRISRRLESITVPSDMLMSLLSHARGVCVAMDEAPVILGSYDWNKIPKDIILRFSQGRKLKLKFFYTSQGFSHSLKRLRDLTYEVVLCKKLPLFNGFFSYTTYDPQFFNYSSYSSDMERKYVINRSILWPWDGVRYFSMYDTDLLVDPIEYDRYSQITDTSLRGFLDQIEKFRRDAHEDRLFQRYYSRREVFNRFIAKIFRLSR